MKLGGWKEKVRELKAETHALYLALKDPPVPWYAKLCGACVLAYVFSPIDLIPHFIPVLGYVDDLILVPLGIALTIKMIPAEILVECRAKSRARIEQGKLLTWVGAAFVIAVWILVAAFAISVAARCCDKP